MRTWDDYKNYVKAESAEGKREIEECEELSRLISQALNGLHKFGLYGFTVVKSPRHELRRKIHADIK